MRGQIEVKNAHGGHRNPLRLLFCCHAHTEMWRCAHRLPKSFSVARGESFEQMTPSHENLSMNRQKTTALCPPETGGNRTECLFRVHLQREPLSALKPTRIGNTGCWHGSPSLARRASSDRSPLFLLYNLMGDGARCPAVLLLFFALHAQIQKSLPMASGVQSDRPSGFCSPNKPEEMHLCPAPAPLKMQDSSQRDMA